MTLTNAPSTPASSPEAQIAQANERRDAAAREADLARTQADLAKAQDDVNRRAPLVASGAVGKEEYQHATAQLAAAKSAMVAAQSAALAAKEQLATGQVMTEGTTVEQHPNVQRAVARVREAARWHEGMVPRAAFKSMLMQIKEHPGVRFGWQMRRASAEGRR